MFLLTMELIRCLFFSLFPLVFLSGAFVIFPYFFSIYTFRKIANNVCHSLLLSKILLQFMINNK